MKYRQKSVDGSEDLLRQKSPGKILEGEKLLDQRWFLPLLGAEGIPEPECMKLARNPLGSPEES